MAGEAETATLGGGSESYLSWSSKLTEVESGLTPECLLTVVPRCLLTLFSWYLHIHVFWFALVFLQPFEKKNVCPFPSFHLNFTCWSYNEQSVP